MNITSAEKAALEAVRDGKCWRRYHTKGNTLHGEGVSSQTLWRLERHGLFRDAAGDHFMHRVPQALTWKGIAVLESASGERPNEQPGQAAELGR